MPILWKSTRGGAAVAFDEALRLGYPREGGMFVPDEVPALPHRDILRAQSFKQLCVEILGLFVPPADLARRDLISLVDRAFASFDDPTQVVELAPAGDRMTLAELYHGPTLAFKDLAMSVLGQLLEHYQRKANRNVCLVVGTSGDTGPSAIEAVRGVPRVSLVVLYPRGRVSRGQELQMIEGSRNANNVRCVCVDGTSDDLDEPCYEVFGDAEFRERHNIGTINSPNIVRLIVQTVHIIYITLRSPAPATVVLPTGAGGHLAATILAKKMGLDIAGICVATNDNDVFDRFVSTGEFRPAGSVVATSAPAMDINVPYNWERLLYFLRDDTEMVAGLMAQFAEAGAVTLTDAQRGIMNKSLGICSGKASTQQIADEIAWFWQKHRILIDPHTAIGTHVGRRMAATSHHVVVCSTAHPAKFPEAILNALPFLHSEQDFLDFVRRHHPSDTNALALLTQLANPNPRSDHVATFSRDSRRDWTLMLRAQISELTGNGAGARARPSL